ncbi:MAG TPA: 4a-hydroxytetrahydrobiopterin dehydratase [Acidimicrobiales bacterium]|nr:4a-hydroxytetrahydrobiopterin dehydratase [Acidimicrobiales bacterium]
MERLSDEAVAEAAGRLGWEVSDGRLTRVVERKDFAQAMELVNTVAQLAEAANHHPDIGIRWNKVDLTLWTHTAGGVTQADLDMAAAIDGLLGEG